MVKDDGLAAGKGVVVTADRGEAAPWPHAWPPGGRVVVEEFLDGPEVSLFCLTDGTTRRAAGPRPGLQARAATATPGPNTGGMGAYSPLPWAPPDLAEEVAARRVAAADVAELARRGTPFAGLLYAGLALTARGVRVIEFNARFGDPETQVVLARLATPLGGLLHAAATGVLAEAPELRWRAQAAVTVVVAAEGYPAAPVGGDVVEGLEAAGAVPGAWVLHAGTSLDADGRVVDRRRPGAVRRGHRRRPRRGAGGRLRGGRADPHPRRAPPLRHRGRRGGGGGPQLMLS